MSAVEACDRCTSSNKTSSQPVMNNSERQVMVNEINNNMMVKYHSLVKAFVSEKKINRQLQDQVQSMENVISLSKWVALERDQEIQSRLESMKDTIFARDRELQSQLQTMEGSISATKQLANSRDRELQDLLRSTEENISNIYTDLHNMSSFMTTISSKIDEHLLKVGTTSVKPDVTTVPSVNTNCRTVPDSGVYTINLELIMSPVSVYCDQDTDGGGWIVFMRRQDGTVNFTRSWTDYKRGFGSPDGEFWVGNEFLYKITKSKPLQLRIDMEDFDGDTAFAVYEEFKVGTEEDKYRLHVTGYSGTAGDSFGEHAGMQFSTFDSDNDKYGGGSCAIWCKGGWWYTYCYDVDLNGPYNEGVTWYTWKGMEPLKHIEMKIR